MSADSDALKTVQQLPGLTQAEQQYLLAVARGEGFYGLGWGNTKAMSYQRTAEEAARLGINPQAGVGSFNWGAIQGTGSAGSFPHVDHHADGSAYVGKYKKYSTNVEGAADMARILLKPNVKLALASGVYKGEQVGPLKAAVFTQHDNGYFELKPESYLTAVSRNYDALTHNLQWPTLLLTKVQEIIADTPLDSTSSGSALPDTSSGSPLPEAGFLRGEKYSVPGVQDEPSKKQS